MRGLRGGRLGQGTGSKIETSVASEGAGTAASVGTSAALTAVGAPLAVVGAIVPVVGTIIGALIGGLLSGHFAREQGAKNENQALQGLIPAVAQDITSVFQAANAGQISATDAITALQTIQQNFWTAVQPYQSGPGQAMKSACQQQTDTPGPGITCNKSCTASCCVGCNVINEWVYKATRIFQSNGQDPTSIPWNPVVGNKYGLQNFTPPSSLWTYTAAGSTATGASLVSGVSSLLGSGSFLSGSLLGIPIWVLLAAAGLWLWAR